MPRHHVMTRHRVATCHHAAMCRHAMTCRRTMTCHHGMTSDMSDRAVTSPLVIPILFTQVYIRVKCDFKCGGRSQINGGAVNHKPIDLRAAGQFPRRFIHKIEMTFFLRDMHVHTRTHSSLCRPPHLSVLDTHTDN